MPLFYLKYKILEAHRSDCITLFGGMTEEMDKHDMGPDIKLLGRWNTVGESAGFCICESTNVKALNNWLLNWSEVATIICVPILDDNMARTIILKKMPSYNADYTNINAEAKKNESLYFIEYKFHENMAQEGYDAFAKMSEEDDKADAGNNTCYGRWHNLGTGSGVAICSSKGEFDLYKWAFNWSGMCTCVITPVVSDADCRNNIRSKPDFAIKHAALMDKKGKHKKTSYWFR